MYSAPKELHRGLSTKNQTQVNSHSNATPESHNNFPRTRLVGYWNKKGLEDQEPGSWGAMRLLHSQNLPTNNLLLLLLLLNIPDLGDLSLCNPTTATIVALVVVLVC